MIYRYDIDMFDRRIRAWGSGTVVHAIALSDSVVNEMATAFERFDREVLDWKADDPIPVALRHYSRTGRVSPSLKPRPLWGTPFQRRVWDELSRLPAGQLVTYGELAEKIGKPKAARAVGRAVGANPIPIVIPCHRVVAKNGPGGFGGDLRLKAKLLSIEGLNLPEKH